MDLAFVFLTLGGLFLAGLLADEVGRRTRLPRVTLLLACGIAVGEAGFGWLPEAAFDWYGFLSVSALTMVAFLLGGALTREALLAHGRVILWVSGAVVLVTLAIVTAGLAASGAALPLALVLGAIATATAPAATLDVIRQTGVKSGFTDTLEGIVAIDDAWGLIAFSVALTVALGLTGNGGEGAGPLVEAAREIVGAIVLGAAVGVPAAYLTGRLKPGEPMQMEALGIVFLTAGLAIWLDLSFLIAGMTAGAIIVNLARHHERSFHEIEHVQWPFMLLFFILAGSSLEIDQLAAVGGLGLAYIALRSLARVIGAGAGAILGGAPVRERPLYGLALLPQAGVAVGMALVAAEALPDYAATILTVTIASTIIFEIVGPFGTIWAIRRAEAGPPAAS
ncbi:MAG: cation:proton antiporter [Paracoccaceae bacterium]|nr:cation:proton antiporter [Paracoccaceae bacterium]